MFKEMKRRDRPSAEPPNFLQYDAELNMMTLQAQAGGYLQYSPEQVF